MERVQKSGTVFVIDIHLDVVIVQGIQNVHLAFRFDVHLAVHFQGPVALN